MSKAKPIPKHLTPESLKGRYFIDEKGCWIWTGAKIDSGYGYVHLKIGNFKAHRVSYAVHGNKLIQGLELDHICRVKLCINPSHLRQVSHRENVIAGECPTAINAKKTHCPKGHPYSGDNVCYLKSGQRGCRTCWRLARKALYKKNPEKILAYQRGRYKKETEK